MKKLERIMKKIFDIFDKEDLEIIEIISILEGVKLSIAQQSYFDFINEKKRKGAGK